MFGCSPVVVVTRALQGFAVPSLPFPTWIIKALAPVVPIFKLVASKLGTHYKTDGSKAARVLGIQYRPARVAVLEAAESLVETGLVKPTRRRRMVLLVLAVGLLVLMGYVVLKRSGFV